MKKLLLILVALMGVTTGIVQAQQTIPMVILGNPTNLNINLPLNTGAELWRDVNNGQWRGGSYFDPLGISYGVTNYAEFGISQSWTTNNGYPGYGAHIGLNGFNIINQLQTLVTNYNLVNQWAPFSTVSNWVRFNIDWNYLADAPGPGTRHNTWGFGVDVNVPVSTVMGWIQNGL
jgi:hypothetical protein